MSTISVFFIKWPFVRGTCLAAIAGEGNQSETKSLISYCVTATSPVIHMGTREHDPISSSLTHIRLLCWILQISTTNMINDTHHQHDNHRTLQGILIVMCVI